MQEIELSPKKMFKLKYGGQVYDLRKPTLGEARQLQALQTSGEGTALDALLDSLQKMGLPREISEQFDGDELEELLSKLTSKKS